MKERVCRCLPPSASQLMVGEWQCDVSSTDQSVSNDTDDGSHTRWAISADDSHRKPRRHSCFPGEEERERERDDDLPLLLVTETSDVRVRIARQIELVYLHQDFQRGNLSVSALVRRGSSWNISRLMMCCRQRDDDTPLVIESIHQTITPSSSAAAKTNDAHCFEIRRIDWQFGFIKLMNNTSSLAKNFSLRCSRRPSGASVISLPREDW